MSAERDELRAKLAAKMSALQISREPKPRPYLATQEATRAPKTAVVKASEPIKKEKKRKAEVVPEQKPAIKKAKKETKPVAVVPSPPAAPAKIKESISFGNFSFGKKVDTRERIKHGSKKVRINREIKSIKSHEAALKRAQEKGGVEAKMNLIKQTAMERALKRAAGHKVHDNLGKLKKTQRARDAKKQKSANAWSKRTMDLTDAKQQRIDKRNDNISKFKLNKKPSLTAEAEPLKK